MYPELTEEQRFPLLTPKGRKLLHRMRQHPRAPRWNWPNGEQLNAAGLKRVFEFQENLFSQGDCKTLEPPSWIEQHVNHCVTQVPFYRSRAKRGTTFEKIGSFRRQDLAPRVWEFVPDNQPLDELITFSSSGTTGHPTRTPHHPFSAACGVPLIEYALKELHSLTLLRDSEHVAITNFAAYPGAFTTAIVVSYLREAGCVRVNLDTSAWRDPEDRNAYINEWQAPVWLGDPVAFGAAESLEFDHKPSAIVSSIVHLTEGYAAHLSQKYSCPVVDLYAMTEAGIIAARSAEGYCVLAHDVHVEILGEDDKPLPTGAIGEITLTTTRNPFLPLLRYRTGDFGSLHLVNGKRVIRDFAGRSPIEYRSSSGRPIHSMQLNHLLRRHPVRRFAMETVSSDEYELHIQGNVDRSSLEAEVAELFGDNVRVIYDNL